MLEPIVVPEENRPKPGAISAPQPVAHAMIGQERRIPLSHRTADFITNDQREEARRS
jgi:hypothetical protein